MVGKIILAVILVVILLIIWKVWHMCSTGKSSGLLGKMFAGTCHFFTS